MVKQISVFLENKQGRLASVAKILGDNSINIRALSIADTTDFGILRLIVSDPDLAYKILTETGLTVSIRDVLAISINDEAGSLSKALIALQEKNIMIEYMYAFTVKTGNNPLVILKVSDIENAVRALTESDIIVVEAQEVYSI